MRSTLDLITATLRAGMTTDLDEDTNYYVKEWYAGDPLMLPMITVPAGAAIPEIPSSRLIEFVGEDTITDMVAIRFYILAAREGADLPEVAAGVTKMLAMLERACLLLRVDPTFGSQFVMSEIRDVNAQLPGIPGQNAYRIGQIRFECKRRALWGQ